MDRDVELAVEQAHVKWIVKTLVRSALVLCGIGFGAAYACERSDNLARVEEWRLKATQAREEANKAMWEHMAPAPKP